MKYEFPSPKTPSYCQEDIHAPSSRLTDEKISDDSGAETTIDSALKPAGLKNPFWKYGPGASVVGHCDGVMAALRAVETWNVPSESGASEIQSALGFGAAPKPLLRKVPRPRSR